MDCAKHTNMAIADAQERRAKQLALGRGLRHLFAPVARARITSEFTALLEAADRKQRGSKRAVS